MIDQPKISVVTVVYNNKQYIEGCIKSVINQTYKNVEYLVIDGASTDGTKELIEAYASQVSLFISEPDNGIGDAMNKGINLATGDYIIFLHADDYFYAESSLEQAVQCLQNKPDILLCDILFGKDFVRQTSRGLDWRTNFKTGVWHQGSLCKRSLFENFGGFDVNVKITMDYEFFLRMYRNGIKAQKSKLILSVMRDTGISSQTDWPMLRKRFMDEKAIHKRYSSNMAWRLIYQLYWALYLPYRKFKS